MGAPLASALHGPSVTQRLQTMASKIARLLACLDGASRVAWIARHRPRLIFHHALVFLPDLQHLAWRPQLSLALQTIRLQFRPWMTMPLVISPTHAAPAH